MVTFLKKFFRFKTKEVEAKLRPTAGCTFGGVGEIELGWFTDGSVKAELELKHSSVPDGSEVEFMADGRRLGAAIVQRGFAKAYETLSAESFTVKEGSKAELRLNGDTVYEGFFRPD
jgi:hypothetical protein